MPEDPEIISRRKKEHLELCLNDDVGFKTKTNGFDKYDFIHDAATEVEIDKINFKASFFKKKISYPFIISCMTGGIMEAENINARLAFAAQKLNIPIGVGSQRQALEDSKQFRSYKIIRENAPSIPVLANIGAAQVVKFKSLKPLEEIVDMINADALVIHLNPLQELLQKEDEANFKGLLKKIKKITKQISVPLIVKEVGSGIGPVTSRKLLEAGVKGIDVAGSGGTSWAGVEILRNKNNDEDHFWDWGIPTSYCIKEIYKFKKKYKFVLIGSGGINSPIDMAKAFALGSDFTASARIVLQELDKKGTDGVISLIENWFETLRKIMFLTGSSSLKQFRNNKLIKKENYF